MNDYTQRALTLDHALPLNSRIHIVPQILLAVAHLPALWIGFSVMATIVAKANAQVYELPQPRHEIIDSILELEIDPEDAFTLPDFEKIIERCSEELSVATKKPDSVLFEIYLHRGYAFARSRRYDDAVKDFDQSLKFRPRDARAAYFRAVSIVRSGKKAEGLTELRKVINLHPKFAKGYLGLASYYYYEEPDYVSALEFAEKAVTLDPNDPLPYFVRALAHLEMEDNGKALTDLQECIARGSIEPGSAGVAWPYVYRSYIYVDILGKPNEGLRDILMGIRLGPTDIECRIGLWDYYFKTGRYHVAKLISQQISDGEGRDDGALQCRALDLVASGMFDEALAAAEKAVESRSTDPRSHCYLTRGNVHFARGHFNEALKDYDKAASIRKDDFLSLGSKAYLLATCPVENLRNGKTALQLATQCGKKTSMENARFLMLLAMAHAECEDFDQAISFAKKSLEKAHPQFPWLEEYKRRLKLFQEKKPYRFDPASKVFDFIY
jgi:tetratricopeptide (TPR) repeat protein